MRKKTRYSVLNDYDVREELLTATSVVWIVLFFIVAFLIITLLIFQH